MLAKTLMRNTDMFGTEHFRLPLVPSLHQLYSRFLGSCFGLAMGADPVHRGEKLHTVRSLETLDEVTHSIHSRNR